MSCKKELEYNETDLIYGYQDFGQQRCSRTVATHIRGIIFNENRNTKKQYIIQTIFRKC